MNPLKPDMRNYRLGVVNGVLYILSETLLDPTLVLIAYLSHLTQSPILLGILLPLRDGAWALPQLWVATFLPAIPRKITYYQKLSVVRILSWGSIALVINFVNDPSVVLVAFFIAYALASLASGLSGLAFLEIVGKTIPAERRGEFFAWRFGLGGLMGVGASLLVRWLIAPDGPLLFPHNYGVLAALYFVAASSSLLLYNLVDEPPDEIPGQRKKFSGQLRQAWAYLRSDAVYRKFITMQAMMTVAGSATPFFAVFVQQSLGGSKAMVGVYLAVTIITNLLSNLFFGRMSRRFGNRRVMVSAMFAGLCMSLFVTLLAIFGRRLGVTGRAADLFLVPVFVLSGMRGTGIGVAANSLLLDIAPLSARTLYLGFSNTFLGLVMLATFASGLVLSLVGFAGLAALTLGAHLLAFSSAMQIRMGASAQTITFSPQED